MSINNFNNLPNVTGTNRSSPLSPSSAGQTDQSALVEHLTGGNGWFSQLDSGKSHVMKPYDQFGPNPSLDHIVDEVIKHLGLPLD